MCLAVYLGSTVPIEEGTRVEGNLAIERSDWVPAPLSEYSHIYFVGSWFDENVGCSCPLYETLDYETNPPQVLGDPLMDAAPRDPLEHLNELCRTAIKKGAQITLVCDGNGGVASDLNVADYQTRTILLNDIRRGTLLFDDNGDWATRILNLSTGAPGETYV